VSNASFQVIYDGPALVGSTIDVRDLAPALLALGEVIEQANATLNDGQTKVALHVRASFKSGSFGIDFSIVQGLLDQALNLFKHTPVASAQELAGYLGFVGSTGYGIYRGVIGLIRWLRGRQIREVVLLENGRVRVVVDDDALETERAAIELLRNFRLRIALEKAIAEPLEKDGIESVAITDDPTRGFILIEKRERFYFIAPTADVEELDDRVEHANLQIVSVSFRDDNKWRFSDGSSVFYAAILDDAFSNKVATGDELFAAGDILTVRLRRRQWIAGDTMKSEYEVIEVIDHRRAMAQLRIPFREGT